MVLPLQPPSGSKGWLAVLVLLAGAGALVVGLTVVPLLSSANLFALPILGTQACNSSGGSSQPAVSARAKGAIPANYLSLYQLTGRKYGVPWVVLAGIGEVESDDGRANIPGVHSGQNGFGAAGPMQLGVGGAAGNAWGGPPIHPAGEDTGGVATDGDRDGTDNVYDPADAIPAAARFLLAHGAPGDLQGALFDYNHLDSYVQDVLGWAARYAGGGYTVGAANLDNGAACAAQLTAQAPSQVAGSALSYAQGQIGKPYTWGAAGPDAFDCSGLVMAAYATAGITVPRTSQAQFAWGPRVRPGQEQPGDLVFFAGADGTPASPGHVGIVVGNGMMIEAYGPGVPVRTVSYRSNYPGGQPVGFTRPWSHPGAIGSQSAEPTPGATSSPSG
jgi:peptidoglycan DL-endopeptidase CwlO